MIKTIVGFLLVYVCVLCEHKVVVLVKVDSIIFRLTYAIGSPQALS